jgi:hypothetical protein
MLTPELMRKLIRAGAGTPTLFRNMVNIKPGRQQGAAAPAGSPVSPIRARNDMIQALQGSSPVTGYRPGMQQAMQQAAFGSMGPSQISQDTLAQLTQLMNRYGA